MYKYYYKYDREEHAFYIFLDKQCTCLVARLQETTKQQSFMEELKGIMLVYEGEIS